MKYLKCSSSSLVTMEPEELDVGQRIFKYEISEKRAKANLLRGAKRSKHIETESKKGCINIRFSDGAYFDIVLASSACD